MSTITILGKKYNILILVASVVLSVFILSLTVSDCTSCDGKCNKKGGKSCCCGGKGCEKCGSAPLPAGNIVGADDGTFSELADV